MNETLNSALPRDSRRKAKSRRGWRDPMRLKPHESIRAERLPDGGFRIEVTKRK